MKSGALIVHMDTISFIQPPTLDAILGGMAYQEHFDGPLAAKVPEIARRDGVAMASQAILIGRRGNHQRTHTRSFMRHMSASPEIINATTGKEKWRRDIQKMPYGTIIQTTNVVQEIAAVAFIAVCDPEAVMERFARHSHIGTNRKDHGIVKNVEWIDLDTSEYCGIVGNDQLLRPVPVTKLEKWKVSVAAMTAYGFWQNPYHPNVAARAGIDAEPVRYPIDILQAFDIDEALSYGASA